MIPDDMGIRVSDSVRRLIQCAESEAAQLGQKVGPEHLALAFLDCDGIEEQKLHARRLGIGYRELHRILSRHVGTGMLPDVENGDIESLIRSAAKRAHEFGHPLLDDVHVEMELMCSPVLTLVKTKRRWWSTHTREFACEELAELLRLARFDGVRWWLGKSSN